MIPNVNEILFKKSKTVTNFWFDMLKYVSFDMFCRRLITKTLIWTMLPTQICIKFALYLVWCFAHQIVPLEDEFLALIL